VRQLLTNTTKDKVNDGAWDDGTVNSDTSTIAGKEEKKATKLD
jgi:hypothetical protein